MSLSKYLPDELAHSIATLLPVKSLLRFKCLSTSWCSLITHPDFVRSKLRHNQESTSSFNNNSLIYESCVGALAGDSCSVLCGDTSISVIKLCDVQIPVSNLEIEKSFRLIGSFDGLLLLSPFGSYGITIFVFNPSVRKFKKMSLRTCFTGSLFRCHTQVVVGFGLHRTSNDYRIIRIVTSIGCPVPEAEVYSLRSDSWRRLESAVPCEFLHPPVVALNGNAHWLASKVTSNGHFEKLIVLFDFEDEVFRRVTLPEYNPDGKEVRLFVAVLEEMLSLIVCSPFNDMRGSISIWTMLRYGSDDSWKEQHIFEPMVRVAKPLGITRGSDLLLEMSRDVLFTFDLHAQIYKRIDVKRSRSSTLEIVPYVESLFLCEEGTW